MSSGDSNQVSSDCVQTFDGNEDADRTSGQIQKGSIVRRTDQASSVMRVRLVLENLADCVWKESGQTHSEILPVELLVKVPKK